MPMRFPLDTAARSAALTTTTAIALALAACSGPGDGAALPAPDAAAGGANAIASVNGEPISQRMLEGYATVHNMDVTRRVLRDRALRQLADYLVLEQAAKSSGWLQRPEFAGAAEVGRLQAIAAAATQELQDPAAIDEAAVRAEYERQFTAARDYVYGEMLFRTKEQAAAAAAAVAGGQSFDKVLADRRGDAVMMRPSVRMRSSRMDPQLAQALAQLSPGQSTREPVQARQGWAVLRLQSASEAKALPYEHVADSVRRTLARDAGAQRLQALRAEARMTGIPAAPASAPRAGRGAPAPAPTAPAPARPAPGGTP